MKQGKPLITFVMFALAAVLAVYLGFYVFNALNEPYDTTMVYAYTANDSVTADGLLVREEHVFPAQAGIVELTRSEGEKVGVGQTVALAYRDSQAQADRAQLEAIRRDIALLEYAVSQTGDVESAARLDEDILQAMVELRSAAALDDYSDLEDQVMAVKSGILKRGYTYGDGLTAADLTAQLRALNGQLTELTRRSSSATTRVSAPQSGVFSSQVDGYESILTPASLTGLTPSDLSRLMDSPPAAADPGTGKLITGRRWQFAANLPAEAAARLTVGETALLRFTGDFSQDVDMVVDHISPAEGETALVVFSTDRFLEQTTLLRRQTAELIFASYSGLRVPKTAMRLIQTETEDEETGQVVQENVFGVYALVNGRTEFKAVEVVVEGSDYYVVKPVGADRKVLRAGDTIIIRGTDLQNGQLLET